MAIPDDQALHVSDFLSAAGGNHAQALLDAWEQSKSLITTPYATYDFTAPQFAGIFGAHGAALFAAAEPVYIQAARSRFILPVVADRAALLRLRGQWLYTQSVTAIDYANAKITLASASSYRRGDVIKMVDSTPLPEYTYNSRKGEFLTVESVSGNVLTVNKTPYYLYDLTKNTKVAKINPDVTVNLDIGEIVLSEAGLFRDAISLEAVAHSRVRLRRAEITRMRLVELKSCYDVQAQVDYAANGPSDSGTAIGFSGSEYCHARVLFAREIRHAIDSGSADSTDTTVYDFSKCGATAYCTQTGTAEGTHQGAFGSHHGTRHCVAKDFLVIGGDTAVGWRGIHNVAVNGVGRGIATMCSSVEQTEGREGYVTESHSNSFVNCQAFGLRHLAVQVNGSQQGGVTVHGCYFQSYEGDNAGMIEVANCPRLTISGKTRFDYTLGTAVNRVVTQGLSVGIIDLGDSSFSFNQASMPSRFIQLVTSAAPATLRWHDLRIDNPGSTLSSIVTATSLAAASQLGDLTVSGSLTSVVSGLTTSQIIGSVTGTIAAAGNQLRIRPAWLN